MNVRSCPKLIEAVESEGFGGSAVVAPAFGDVQVVGVFDGRMMAARIVARLASPLPVRLVAVSSLNVTSRTRRSPEGKPVGTATAGPARVPRSPTTNGSRSSTERCCGSAGSTGRSGSCCPR